MVDALDDSGSAKHAGFEEKEARRLRRQKRLAKAGKERIGRGRVKEDLEYAPSFLRYTNIRLIFTEQVNLLYYTKIHQDRRLGTDLKRQILSSGHLLLCARLTTSQKTPS